MQSLKPAQSPDFIDNKRKLGTIHNQHVRTTTWFTKSYMYNRDD